MCKCDPNTRTPFCGKPGCEWPSKQDSEVTQRPRLGNSTGYFDLKDVEYCDHIRHNPPTFIHIPAGKGYRHFCPGCGRTVVLTGGDIRC